MKHIFLLFLCLFTVVSCAHKSVKQPIDSWMSYNAIPLNSVLAGNDSKDLQSLKQIIGDAKIIGLGEPTHGNKEVFQLKNRMVEYLVRELGFNIFALECPFGEAYDINRYILDGIGDPEKALAGIYYWTWETKEFVELLKWMRTYNANPTNTNKLKFYGFDPQDPERAAGVTLEYLSKVDLKLYNKVISELAILQVPFSNPDATGRRQWIPEEYDAKSLAAIKEVILAFDTNKADYLAISSLSEWEISRQHAKHVEFYIAASSEEGGSYNFVRDLSQAKNIKWILESEGDDAKVIIWAHNSHVGNTPRGGDPALGYHLKKWYDDQYKVFGFFFNQGSFKSLDASDNPKGMQEFTLGPAPDNTLESVMSKVGQPLSIVDLQQLSSDDQAYNWFNQPQLTRHSGGGYNSSNPQRYFLPYKLADAFDALVYLHLTTAVDSIDDTDYDFLAELDKKIPRPMNTGFELNEAGAPPEHWVVWSKFRRLGITMEVSDVDPYKGKHSAMIKRTDDILYGEIAPNLIQYIDAKPYRGKTIRLSMAARAETINEGYAFIRMGIDPDPLNSAYDSEIPLFDSFDKYRVNSSNWEIYQIETAVTDNANKITYGVHLRDLGTVWIDEVKIEIID